MNKLLIVAFILLNGCSIVGQNSIDINNKTDDYLLCFPELNPLFASLGSDDRSAIYKNILNEKNERSLDCISRFNNLPDIAKELNNTNNKALERNTALCEGNVQKKCELRN